jgi:hypothetical protein
MLNWSLIAERWPLLGSQTKSRWARLTDEDLLEIGGNQTSLIDKVQYHYGVPRPDAQNQVIEWGTKMHNMLSKPPTSVMRKDLEEAQRLGETPE